MNDYFRIIEGFNSAYRVSKGGEVQSSWTRRGRSCSIGGPWRPLTPIARHGYRTVNLTLGGGLKQARSVHRLVLETFVGPCPHGLVCCHNDGDPTNNCLENLRWGTYQSNSEDKLRHGTMCRGEAARHAKLRKLDVLEIRRLRSEGHSASSLADRFNISPRNVRVIVSGRSWRHLLPHEDQPGLHVEGVGLRGAA